jgi:hypothetical protein
MARRGATDTIEATLVSVARSKCLCPTSRAEDGLAEAEMGEARARPDAGARDVKTLWVGLRRRP